MTRLQPMNLLVTALAAFVLSSPAGAQIVSNEGDGVLNAPYRGTVESLRKCSEDVAYGEVMTHIEPRSGSAITSTSIEVWAEGNVWDRSVVRLFEGLDASGAEVNLTQCSDAAPCMVYLDSDDQKRFSLKAIGTKTFAKQSFTVWFRYRLGSSNWQELSTTVTVVPMTGLSCELPGEAEAFHFGTTILDVSAGAARLTVPIGRTAEMIGATFVIHQEGPDLTGVERHDVLLPGTAESVHTADVRQFRLIDNATKKTSFGTPWPGYLIGFYSSQDVYGPTGTVFDVPASSPTDFWRFENVIPRRQPDYRPPSVALSYDGGSTNRVILLEDRAAVPNSITLTRSLGIVTDITTSDGRAWAIDADHVAGWITAVVPAASAPGARRYEYNDAGRVTRVRDGDATVLYEFSYDSDPSGEPTILATEKRNLDGALRLAVGHEIVSETLRIRRDYSGEGEFRQTDFEYDSDPSLANRLTKVAEYSGVGGTGTRYETTFQHDIENPDGTMAVQQAVLPDGSTVTYEYDFNEDGAGGGSASMNAGFLSKVTLEHSGSSLTSYDVTHDFVYCTSQTTPCTTANKRLYYWPRKVKHRDGAGHEVVFEYDAGGRAIGYSDVAGEQINRLLSVTGPTIALGPSAPRTPKIVFEYHNATSFPTFLLERSKVLHDATNYRVEEYDHDELGRVISATRDPTGDIIQTQFLYCDAAATQDRVTVDADGYCTGTTFDNDGRVKTVRRYLDPVTPADPCVAPGVPFYQTENVYDSRGWLFERNVDNKDQNGTPLTPMVVTTRFTPMETGWVDDVTRDYGGINQLTDYVYGIQGDVDFEYDTSGRGIKLEYEGRGLLEYETPVDVSGTPAEDLKIQHEYDSVGRLTFTTYPTGVKIERQYDDFGRLEHLIRIPGPGGGATIKTTYGYDDSNNVTSVTVYEDATPVSQTTAKYDEGNFRYETRRHLVADVDGPDDPVTKYEFDWAGNVTKVTEDASGDATVADAVISNFYDGAGRVDYVTDSEGGWVDYTLDGRGNVEERKVKLDAADWAFTNINYDSLSRPILITEPEDGENHRANRQRKYDSLGNLVFESLRDHLDVPRQTVVASFDNLGRMTRSAVLANAAATTPAENADPEVDRVIDWALDADGRVELVETYNNNSATPLETDPEYDALGRIDTISDPAGNWSDNQYASNGRLDRQIVFDGVGTRTFTFSYDGHDRVTGRTALGVPSLTTAYEWDGLDRVTKVTDPRNIATQVGFDLAGRRNLLLEDAGGALERRTEYGHNRLDQLITQTVKNETSGRSPLADQVTTYRHDTMGRPTRVVFPDADAGQHADPTNCTDCVKTNYDVGGRVVDSTDQRGTLVDYEHDHRGLLLTRTVGTDRDSYAYDAAGRLILGQRGTTTTPDAVSSSVIEYTDLGDPDYEIQTIAAGTPRTVNYSHDQAGLRTQTTYPGGEILAYTPTALGQVDTVTLGGNALVDYDYDGVLLRSRRTTTSAPGGTSSYLYETGYDSHRRINAITNSFEDATRAVTTIADYSYTHDNAGHQATQTAIAGLPAFASDDRGFTVDRLGRLTATDYFEIGKTEVSVLDRVGNRESHTDRTGATTAYGLTNAANEYSTIGGAAVAYDAAGNLVTDADGRRYYYDEYDRLTEVRASDDVTKLATYTYDALGRRIVFSDPVAGTTTRYYHDGGSVIEERDDSDVRQRYHVNGAQYIDERVASYSDAAGPNAAAAGFTYYLFNTNYSVAGTGNADGTSISRVDFSSTGDFAGGGGAASSYHHDADGDLDIDLYDYASIQNCRGSTDPTCLATHDFDTSDLSDGDVELDDYARFAECFQGMFVTPDPACGVYTRGRAVPTSGTFALHGRPVDTLSDDHVLMNFRARFYDPAVGRWLQRDPTGYTDGGNLYEAFRGNAGSFRDPFGTAAFSDADDLLNEYYLDPETLAKYHVLTQERGISLTLHGNPVVTTRPSSLFERLVSENIITGPNGAKLYREETPGLLLLGKDRIPFSEADSYTDVASRLSQSIDAHWEAFFGFDHSHGRAFEILNIALPLEEFESAATFGRIGEYGIASGYAGLGVAKAGANLYGGYSIARSGLQAGRRVFVRVVQGTGDEAVVTRVVGLAGRPTTVTTSATPVPLAKSAASTELTLGFRPKLVLSRSQFTPQEIAAINRKYNVANLRIASGAETAEIGTGVPYRGYASRKFVRDTLRPGVPVRDIRIPEGLNVDEFVSRQFGGRQVRPNQHLLDARVNQLLGTLEYNATRGLREGTKIQGFRIEWTD